MTDPVIIAAFDPGLSGAVALCRGLRNPHWEVRDLPLMGDDRQTTINGAELAKFVRDNEVEYAVVEFVHAFPGQGVSSMFKFGTAFGQILGVLQALGVPYELVQAAKWKREMRLPGGRNKGEASRQRALELLPQMASRLERRRDHNRAEALLLAYWWRNRRQ